MITLDKVQLLEERIRKAVALINRLRQQNEGFKEQINILKMHNDELKDFANTYNKDNEMIELGLSKAMAYLDDVEGLNDMMPVEDYLRNQEFAEMDNASASEADFADDEQSNEPVDDTDTIINYEDSDPLI